MGRGEVRTRPFEEQKRSVRGCSDHHGKGDPAGCYPGANCILQVAKWWRNGGVRTTPGSVWRLILFKDNELGAEETVDPLHAGFAGEGLACLPAFGGAREPRVL